MHHFKRSLFFYNIVIILYIVIELFDINSAINIRAHLYLSPVLFNNRDILKINLKPVYSPVGMTLNSFILSRPRSTSESL